MVKRREKDIAKRPAKQGAEAIEGKLNEIRASTPFDFKGENLTAYGGLLPVAAMLERLEFEQVVRDTVTMKRETTSMPQYQFILAMLCRVPAIEPPAISEMGADADRDPDTAVQDGTADRPPRCKCGVYSWETELSRLRSTL